MNKSKIIILIPCLLLQMLCFSSCGNSAKLQDRVYDGPALTGEVFADSQAPVLSNNRLELYLDENMSVRLVDKKTAVTWSTNGNAGDGSALPNQFILRYTTKDGTLAEMESQKDSVDKNQAKAYKQDGALYVEYHLGSFEKTLNDVPSQLSEERFKECFLNKLDDQTQEEIQQYYKYFEEDNAWRIKSKGKNNFKRILEIMDEVGYTEEDLKKDNKMFGIITQLGKNPAFTVVLKYTLNDAGLKVTLPNQYIEFLSSFPLYEIHLLQNFGKIDQGTDGYIFLPDGSGVLMDFSQDYAQSSSLALPVYGADLTVKTNALLSYKASSETVSLPVFGMKDAQGVYLAVITGAESKATINAHPAGTYFKRNTAYVSFRMLDNDRVYLSGNEGSNVPVRVFQNALFEDDCSIEYRFLDADHEYSDMAASYRQYLTEQGALSAEQEWAENTPLLIETLSGVKGYKNFFGVSYTGITSATSYEECAKMIQELMDEGVSNLDMKLMGWFNGGYYHQYIGSLSLNKELGGKKQWNNLLAVAKECGVSLYPDVEFQKFAEAAWGFIPLMDASRSLDYAEVKYSIRSPALLNEKNDIGLKPSYLYVLSPTKLLDLTKKYLQNYKKLGAEGISLRSSGNELYSDFNDKQTVDRTQSQSIMEEHLALVQDTVGSIMVNEGFAFTFPYVDKIANVPMESSNYRIAGESVPFLQMVLHGSKTLYGEPANLSVNQKNYILKSIEYGVNLSYQLTYKESSVLKNTEITTNYSSGYEEWKREILSAYQKVNGALAQVQDAFIIKHDKVAENVTCTEYDNGVKIFVNYNDVAVSLEEGMVSARDYLAVKE